MAAIPGINERAPQRPVFVNHLDELAKGQGMSEKSVQLVKEVVGLLGSDPAVRVSNKAAGIQSAQVGSPTGPTGVPTLDNPDDVKAKEVDLEKLFAYLQLETDKHQAELAKDRIELQKDEMEARHKDQKEKLQTSLEEMSKASTAGTVAKIFGWLMAAAAVALAVVACVATGGAAIGPLIAAGVAVTMAVLNETGVMGKLTEAFASALEEAGLSKTAAQIVASATIAAATIVLTVGVGSVGSIGQAGHAAAEVARTAAQMTAQTVYTGLDIGVKVVGLTSVGVGGYSAYRGFESGHAQADVSEADHFLAMMRQQMDESQEELQQIMDQIQNLYSQIVAILDSETDTQNEIAQKIGTMA